MKKRIALLLLMSTLLLVPKDTNAWGLLGHRIIGQIADKYLSKKAKKEIRKLLGNESIAMASNWPDFIKSDPSFNYLNSWHYVNLPSGLSKEDVIKYLETDTIPNIYNRIKMLAVDMKNPNTSQQQKIMDLRLIIHFMGDLHQPMHTARKEDLGGNQIKLMWFNENSNLHKVWDENLIDYQQLSYTEYSNTLAFASPEQIKEWQGTSVQESIYESYQICEKLYTEIRPNDKLSYKYNFDHIGIVESQLLKGGVRLAKFLNDIFE